MMTATKLAREVSVAASFGSSRIAARIGNIQRICDREVALIHQAFGRRDGYFFQLARARLASLPRLDHLELQHA